MDRTCTFLLILSSIFISKHKQISRGMSVDHDLLLDLLPTFVSFLSVLGRFLDVDHLTSMCVQIPKNETVKTAESKISAVIYLKHTLELVEPLGDALKDTETPLFKAYFEVCGGF